MVCPTFTRFAAAKALSSCFPPGSRFSDTHTTNAQLDSADNSLERQANNSASSSFDVAQQPTGGQTLSPFLDALSRYHIHLSSDDGATSARIERVWQACHSAFPATLACGISKFRVPRTPRRQASQPYHRRRYPRCVLEGTNSDSARLRPAAFPFSDFPADSPLLLDLEYLTVAALSLGITRRVTLSTPIFALPSCRKHATLVHTVFLPRSHPTRY